MNRTRMLHSDKQRHKDTRAEKYTAICIRSIKGKETSSGKGELQIY